ncbi:basic helix-loop-helix (bHLH) DNA-bindingsuperfamily protein [Striga asiatica]|uniref:Basic helix-loop-helix (BHLH) DNA-bindingsuperfamily protein n=1 Tax=Striga asiatica TaxID=4170 RepID=A0A5A7P3B2_STRAF|nr:basic helix-loop-helix (bHLH) DNA-bindingsuperfamily protein [Striga asiatica]
MFSFNNIPNNYYKYEVGSCSDYSYDDIVEGVFGNSPADEAKASAAASHSHKEAERRRRKRINSHIATLKSLLPNAIKTDKASLLGEAVRTVRELKKKIMHQITLNDSFVIPSETDELKVCYDSGLIQATVCCEDRPDLMSGLIRALDSVAAKVVRAEMSTVGGRTKIVLWVRLGSNVNESSFASLERLRRALKPVMDHE